MTNYDLYGFHSGDLNQIATKLEAILNISWVARHSSFIGDYFEFGEPRGEIFTLQTNFDDYEDDWMEPKFKEYLVLLYISNTMRSTELETLISNSMSETASLLRHSNDSA
ncbi:MAG: hypothetical protein H0X30_36285 [Anaerolineae bacterium]|nr:hypothetical protein [Anaerolineae bacterium]